MLYAGTEFGYRMWALTPREGMVSIKDLSRSIFGLEACISSPHGISALCDEAHTWSQLNGAWPTMYPSVRPSQQTSNSTATSLNPINEKGEEASHSPTRLPSSRRRTRSSPIRKLVSPICSPEYPALPLAGPSRCNLRCGATQHICAQPTAAGYVCLTHSY